MVDSNFEKRRAESIVRGLDGVQSVTNALSVIDDNTLLESSRYESYDLGEPKDFTWYNYYPSPSVPDQTIRMASRCELFWSPIVDRDDIRVYVDDGVATLTGTVQDLSELLAAGENAFEGGARAVDHELKIETGEDS
jgi:osmotically-inducible protein OsmY